MAKSKISKSKIKIIVVCFAIVIILWFLILNPLFKFKKNEKTLEDAAKRYYEVNSKLLPKENKMSTVTLQKLYEKDYIVEDLRNSYTSKICDINNSWVKVKKENNEYKYYVYLKCGVFSSKIDHEGPVITLKGNDVIRVNKGEKFKDPGISSVIDNTDGNIDVKKVRVNSLSVNTNKNGTYKITYKIKDSLNNETVKVRKVIVEQVLDKIVKNNVGDNNYYQGIHADNYVLLDGILFKIVGLNKDGTVKIMSNDNLSFVDYNDIDKWLNEYFYNMLSDSAKNLIEKSKWCDDEVDEPNSYKKCDSYSKKKNIGLLSIDDINNSNDENGYNNLEINNDVWTSNLKDTKVFVYGSEGYKLKKKSDHAIVKVVLNIKNNVKIVNGDGDITAPYVLNGNNNHVKVGGKLSNASTGQYVSYSGYNWRIIGKENDESIKIIMDDIVSINDESYFTEFADSKPLISDSKNNNVGYKLINELSSYVNTKSFIKKKEDVLNYKNRIKYNGEIKKGSYSSKMFLPNMYDLYSATVTNDYWYGNYSSSLNKFCYMYYTGEAVCDEFDSSVVKNIRIVAYLDKNTKVKSGVGTFDIPYKIS